MLVCACCAYLQTVLYCRKMLLSTNLCTNEEQGGINILKIVIFHLSLLQGKPRLKIFS